MDKWRHKDEWRREGKDFIVVVSRHTEPPSSFDRGQGANRWAVYAYIYPTHWKFAQFDGDDFWQPATNGLPLHCGVSFLRYHYDAESKITSVQVGADYHHLYDGHYTHYENREQADAVFCDALELFGCLQDNPTDRDTGALSKAGE